MTRLMPRSVKQTIKRVWRSRFPYHCPVCGTYEDSFWPFAPTGRPVRRNALCPVCKSLERHRLSWQFLRRQTTLFDGRAKRLLHVAPEPHLGPRLRETPGIAYVSFDWSSPDAAVHGDLTAMPFASASFDAIFCSHVLEHIPDDRAAMRECARVLRPSGWAVFLVPIQGDQTDEDASVVDVETRIARFGQADHVRFYGLDFAQRLTSSGFDVTVVDPVAVERDAKRRLALQQGEAPLFYCRLPR